LTAVAGFFPGLEKGTSSFINCLKDTSRDEPDNHGMSKHDGENRVIKEQVPSDGEGASSPPREPQIAFSHNQIEIGNTKFVSRERYTKVGLGKGRNGATEDLGYRGGHGGFNFYGKEGALVKIYGEAGGCRDVTESLF
jgi:hypothetical protein